LFSLFKFERNFSLFVATFRLEGTDDSGRGYKVRIMNNTSFDKCKVLTIYLPWQPYTIRRSSMV